MAQRAAPLTAAMIWDVKPWPVCAICLRPVPASPPACGRSSTSPPTMATSPPSRNPLRRLEGRAGRHREAHRAPEHHRRSGQTGERRPAQRQWQRRSVRRRRAAASASSARSPACSTRAASTPGASSKSAPSCAGAAARPAKASACRSTPGREPRRAVSTGDAGQPHRHRLSGVKNSSMRLRPATVVGAQRRQADDWLDWECRCARDGRIDARGRVGRRECGADAG